VESPQDEHAELHRAITEAGVPWDELDANGEVPGLTTRKMADRTWALAGARRMRFLEVFARDPYDLWGACRAVGWKVNEKKVKRKGRTELVKGCPAYQNNRKADPLFAAKVDALRGGRMGRPKVMPELAGDGRLLERAADDPIAHTFSTNGGAPAVVGRDPKGFAEFRKFYFDMDTPWFHQEIVNVLEQSEPGSVTLILLPPEHGKTTLLEDWSNYKLAVDPDFRILYGSEKQQHAIKVLKRVKARMDPLGPCPRYVKKFGPFTPQTGDDARAGQPWNATHFDVWRRTESDERDYNMCAIGFGAAVAGTRCDLLVLDDPQSLKSLNQTDKMVEEFRQDWLSRPGSLGRTVILMTRAGEGDFPERLIELDLIDNIVVHPAIDKRGRYLWPERYTPENYARMQKNAGPAAWARNYQQQPTAASERTFTEEHFEKATDKMHRVGHRPEHIPGLRTAVVGWDPGFGINAFYVGGITESRLVDLDWRTDHGLTSTSQMAQILRDICHHWRGQGIRIAYVVIEDKAFQHGLLNDEAVLAVRDEFGFAISGHQTTGQSKLDDDLGIAAMARSFGAGEIVMPGADDPETIRAVAAMRAELAAWRPNKRGAKLRQDLVMARWFAWMRWRSVRALGGEDRSHLLRMSRIVTRPTQFKSMTLAGAR
jgi:hypothetical protein